MGRARLVHAGALVCLSIASIAATQTAPPPDGWVVLSVEEYRTLRDRANPLPPASPSPISRVRLALPKSGVDLTVGGGFIADHGETANESRWTAFGRPAQALTLTWKRKVDDRRAEQPLRVRARVTELAGLGEDA